LGSQPQSGINDGLLGLLPFVHGARGGLGDGNKGVHEQAKTKNRTIVLFCSIFSKNH
jgi:hypothetical protein